MGPGQAVPLPDSFWRPGDPAPPGYRFRRPDRTKMLIASGSVLAASYTVTTLIASGIAVSGFGVIFAPVGAVPVLGPFALAPLSKALGAGDGTAGALIGLGVVQAVSFGILIRGVVTRKPTGIEPDCAGDLTVSPMAAPGLTGLAISGSL